MFNNPYHTTIIENERFSRPPRRWLVLPLTILHDCMVGAISSALLSCVGMTALLFLMIRSPDQGSENFYIIPFVFFMIGSVWGLLVGLGMGLFRAISILMNPDLKRITLQWIGMLFGMLGSLVGCLVPDYIILELEFPIQYIEVLHSPIFQAILVHVFISMLLSAIMGWFSGYLLHYFYIRNRSRFNIISINPTSMDIQAP